MPMTSAARRASRESSSVQQPRAPVRYERGLDDSARWTPVTSWPASAMRAAATAESTPPDMAASTRSPITAQDYPWSGGGWGPDWRAGGAPARIGGHATVPAEERAARRADRGVLGLVGRVPAP